MRILKMNLNNLTKEQLIETLSKMAEELEMNLANNSVNRLERYVNIDTNEQTFILKTGQMKIKEDALRKLIQDESNDLEIVSEKTSVSAKKSTSILEVKTNTESLYEYLQGCVDAKISLSKIDENEITVYKLKFEFNN